MKKLYSLLVVFSLVFGSSSLEAKRSKSEKSGKQVKDHDGNNWPDWGRVDL